MRRRAPIFCWFSVCWSLLLGVFVTVCEGQEADGSATQQLRIALVQANPNLDPDVNLSRAVRFCQEAARQNADLVLFPEMFSVGYQTSIDFDDPASVGRWRKKAKRSDGSFVARFRDLARDLNLAIAITYLEEKQGGLRNATSLIDRYGDLSFTYAKVHTCRFFPMEGALIPGEQFFVSKLDTRVGPVTVGVMTCYDREFPESARILMLQGAEIILTPNACGLDHLRLKQFQIRAWENSVVAAMANYASQQGNGRSCVYAASGEELFLAEEGVENVYVVDVPLEALRRTRAKTFWGNAWRRTDVYQKLAAPEIDAPFARTDAFGLPNSQSLSSTSEAIIP